MTASASCRRPALLLTLLFCLLFPVPEAGAREAVNEFTATVTVRPDGSLLVREEYSVTAEGDQIKTGLFREFPLKYAGPSDYRGLVPFTVRSVSVDGRELSTTDTQRDGDTLRIFLRNPERLSEGRHTFVLEYETSLHLRYYDDHAELNWNATGVWDFPIEKFRCRIILPPGVTIAKTIAWMGEAGTKGMEDVATTRPAPNEAVFKGRDIFGRPEAAIPPGKQLTVAVSFAKDAIPDPMAPFLEQQKKEDAERQARWAAERAEQERLEAEARDAAAAKGQLALLVYENPYLPRQSAAFVLAVGYFFLLWLLTGRDPAKGTVIPRFHPPVGRYLGKGPEPEAFTPAPMSPLAMEYLLRNTQTSGRGLAALFLSMAVKGLCGIGRTEEGTYILRPGADTERAGIAPEERSAYARLLEFAPPGEELAIRKKQHAMRSMRESAEDQVEATYGKAWKLNTGVCLLGLLLVLPLGLTACFLDAAPAVTSDLEGPPLIFILSALCCTSLLPLFLALRVRSFSGTRAVFACAVPLVTLYVLGMCGFFSGREWILPMLMTLAGFLFSLQMKAPSKACRALMDEIEGLGMYISAAETDRMQMLNRPEDTPAVFQALLPYALVLCLEKTWCNRFAGQIAAGLLEDSGVDASLIRDSNAWEEFASGFSDALAASTLAESSYSVSSGSAFSDSGGGAGSGSGGGRGGGI